MQNHILRRADTEGTVDAGIYKSASVKNIKKKLKDVFHWFNNPYDDDKQIEQSMDQSTELRETLLRK